MRASAVRTLFGRDATLLLTGREIDHTACMADGDGRCVFALDAARLPAGGARP